MPTSIDARGAVESAKPRMRSEERLKPVRRPGNSSQEPEAIHSWAQIVEPRFRELRSRHAQLVAAPTPEAVHELRRALRRARALVLLIDKDLLKRKSSRLAKELEWMTRQLGQVRDLDVLAAKLRNETAYTPQTIEEDALIAIVAEERHCQAATCVAAAGSARAVKLLERLKSWLESRAVLLQDRAVLGKRLSLRLRERDAALIQAGGGIERLGRRGCHRLRAQVKMLKHVLEALPEFCPPDDTYVRALAELDVVLGDLNDAAVCSKLLKRLCVGHALAKPHHARRKIAKGRTDLVMAWGRFAASPVEWPCLAAAGRQGPS